MGICINCSRTQQISNNHISSLTKPLIVEDLTKQASIKHQKPVLDERFEYFSQKEARNAIISNKSMSEADIQLILSVLKNHYIFNSIDLSGQLKIIKKVKSYEVPPKEIIFEEGQPGSCFFVVSSGRLEVSVGNERRILGPGKSFGELALIDDRPRKATVRTVDSCILWGLDRFTFMKALKRIRVSDYEENKKFINSVNIFNILTSAQKEAILGALVTQRWNSGQIVIKEGDNIDMLYIIKEGFAVCNPDRSDSFEIHKGDYFGEQALMYQTPQHQTIIAATDLVLISIGRKSLSQVLGSTLDHILYRNSQKLALEKISSFKSLSLSQRESIIDNSKVQRFKRGEIVITKGLLKSSHLFILVHGRLQGDRQVEPLQCLGDEDIIKKSEEVYLEDFIAVEESDVAVISLKKLEKAIGGEVSQVMISNDVLNILRQVQLLKGLEKEKISALAEALQVRTFEDCDFIVRQNNPGHSFFIIKSGTVKVYRNDRYIRSITKNDYFGERSVLFNDFRTATIVADGLVSCWTLEKSDFTRIISGEVREKLIQRIELQDTAVLFEDLVPVKVIAKGELGIVTLAVHKTRKTLYVLKSMLRTVINDNQIQTNLLLEKNILMQIDHIMIIKLIKTFKDEFRLYYLLEYVRGKDLFDVRAELGKITEEQAKFFAASLVVTLEYLHERKIIHRDVKPENVVIDEEGYIKLIDFGAANIVEGRTYTAIGTPHYLAPEIILRTGYSFSVDWWSLGVLLHELVFGSVPFAPDDEDPVTIYEKILENKLDFSGFPYKSPELKPLITQLLTKNPAARTCGGFGTVKKTAWFNGFSWDRLLSRQLRPPYSAKCMFQPVDVEEALRNNQSMGEFLLDREECRFAKPGRIKTSKTVTLNWDDNF
jgi:cGMP-dependent protein kinase